MLTISKLTVGDRDNWQALFEAYMTFYDRTLSPDMYDRAWREARRKGVARALILAVTEWARARDCSRDYWMTHEDNAVARRLYDRVAQTRGFIRYQIDLTAPV